MGGKIDSATLLHSAWKAREKSYSPYSRFSVGAALITASGAIFRGCNVENISLSLTICAERAAALAAIQAGEVEFAAIALAADTQLPIVPCGACRQFLAEFNPALRIITEGIEHLPREYFLSELFPRPSDGLLNRYGSYGTIFSS